MAGACRGKEIYEKFYKKLQNSIERDNRKNFIKLIKSGAISREVTSGSHIIRVEKGTRQDGISAGKYLSEKAKREFVIVISGTEVLVVFRHEYLGSYFKDKRGLMGTFKEEEGRGEYVLKLRPRKLSPERIAKLMDYVEGRILAEERRL